MAAGYFIDCSGRRTIVIFNSYAAYLKRNFKSDIVVVFDGYGNNSSSIKGVERLRRSNKNLCPNILFDQEMSVTVSQETFLSNQNNKTRFIKFLVEYLKRENISVIQADDDADLLIVDTALKILNKISVIIAEDIDVLVLLTALTPEHMKIYMMKPERGATAAALYSSHSMNDLPYCKKYILFIHAVSGCDTTSCFYGKGKKIVSTSFEKTAAHDENIRQIVETFYKPNESQESIYTNGMAFLLFLYKANKQN